MALGKRRPTFGSMTKGGRERGAEIKLQRGGLASSGPRHSVSSLVSHAEDAWPARDITQSPAGSARALETPRLASLSPVNTEGHLLCNSLFLYLNH